MKTKLKHILKGLLCLNIYSIPILIRKGYENFVSCIVEIYLAYSQSKFKFYNIEIIKLEQIAKDINYNFFLPIHFCKSISTPWYDLLILAVLVKKYNPKTIFEIGTFEGLGSLVMCENCSANVLYTLDFNPNKPRIIPNLKRNKPEQKNSHSSFTSEHSDYLKEIKDDVQINRLFSDSRHFDYSPFFDSIDFFYIDATKTYPYILKDTLNAINCIRKGGTIAWHDVKVSPMLKVLSKLSSFLKIYYIVNSNICFTTIYNKPNQAQEFLIQELKKYEQKAEWA